jgi:hypothetical protein
MENLRTVDLNYPKEKNLKELIEINSILNETEENLNQIQQEIQIKEIKSDSIEQCKLCFNEKCENINKNLCSHCSQRVLKYRISNTLFISGCIIGSSVSGIGLSLNGLNIISFGLSLGILFQSLYNFVILLNV